MRPRRSRSVILMYHSIGDLARLCNQPSSLPPRCRGLKVMRELSAWMKCSGARTDVNSPLRCVISFDDGYENLYENAFPILERLKFPAVAYIPAGVIGETNQRPPSDQKGLSCDENMLSWSQVREMIARGVTIGSHSFDHVDFAKLSEREAFGQLERSRILITERTGQTCHHFAYPWGSFNSQDAARCRECGLCVRSHGSS